MRIKRIKNKISFNLRNPKSKYVIPTAKDDPSLPGLFVFSGSRGSGKTYACVAMITHFEKMGYITRTFMLCPTKNSNHIFKNLKTLDDNDSCEDPPQFQVALSQVLDRIEEEWSMYEKLLKYIKIYKNTEKMKSYP